MTVKCAHSDSGHFGHSNRALISPQCDIELH